MKRIKSALKHLSLEQITMFFFFGTFGLYILEVIASTVAGKDVQFFWIIGTFSLIFCILCVIACMIKEIPGVIRSSLASMKNFGAGLKSLVREVSMVGRQVVSAIKTIKIRRVK